MTASWLAQPDKMRTAAVKPRMIRIPLFEKDFFMIGFQEVKVKLLDAGIQRGYIIVGGNLTK